VSIIFPQRIQIFSAGADIGNSSELNGQKRTYFWRFEESPVQVPGFFAVINEYSFRKRALAFDIPDDLIKQVSAIRGNGKG
jgi:hypothetical protein